MSPIREVPRRNLALLTTTDRDPLSTLSHQNVTRVPELVPLRTERMAASPFTFFRGTAAIMAEDLARDPNSGIRVASCGDAHVSNFGFYASPQRTLLFDLNDFDEAAWAPWEWDVKRLVTSVIIGGRSGNRSDSAIEQAARGAVTAYHRALRTAVEDSALERYFHHFDLATVSQHIDPDSSQALQQAIKKARKKTGARAVRRLTEQAPDGTRRFVLNPPLMTKADQQVTDRIHDAFAEYQRSAGVDVRVLLSHYVVDDVARRVVGVGSVGTRCYLALLRDHDGGVLIIQVKEAGRSVLEEYGGVPQPPELDEAIAKHGQGYRVVGLQRILQAYSDPLLGYLREPDRDFYVRQFHDMKGGLEIDQLEDGPFLTYAASCAVVLARAHAQSPRAREVSAYIGKGNRVVESLVSWSEAYADLSAADHANFVAAQAPGPE